MKRIITLLICAGSFGLATAQTASEESRDIILGKRTGPGSTGTDPRSRDVVLGRNDGRVYREDGSRSNYPSRGTAAEREAINREYDRKVASIRANRTLSASEKERAIRQLNQDRAERLRRMASWGDDDRYEDRQDRDRKDKDYRKYQKRKQNNGNHYGWEKGKGNPKRNSRY